MNIPVSQLLVNPRNPRFDPLKNQNQAIAKMMDKMGQEIKSMAQDIIDNGMNPTKSLAVIKSKDDKFLTLEGNRRVVALKLLNDPNVAEDQKVREYFQGLKDKHLTKIPNSVSCEVFEKEEDALHWIMLEHTGPNKGVGIVNWDSEQRSRFEEQFKNKKSREIQVFDYADENEINREKVEATNLRRLISTPHVCNVIGITFTDGKLATTKSKPEVKKNLKKVFSEMSKDDFKVGDIYEKEDREKWINKVLNVGKRRETKTASDSRKTNPKSTARKHLIPEDCKLLIAEPKINDIYKELQDDLLLDSSKKSTPNAVGVLFRVFLEVSLDYYLKKKIGKQPPNDRTISQKIIEVAEYMEKNNIASKPELSAIRATSGIRNTDILHIDRFHEYVHSSTIQPESDALKVKWNNLQRFFEILWGDLEKKGKIKRS